VTASTGCEASSARLANEKSRSSGCSGSSHALRFSLLDDGCSGRRGAADVRVRPLWGVPRRILGCDTRLAASSRDAKETACSDLWSRGHGPGGDRRSPAQRRCCMGGGATLERALSLMLSPCSMSRTATQHLSPHKLRRKALSRALATSAPCRTTLALLRLAHWPRSSRHRLHAPLEQTAGPNHCRSAGTRCPTTPSVTSSA
jgi:hypothetical protein